MSRSVSAAYLTAINAASEHTAFLAEFGFVPPGAREGMTLTQSGFGRWGNRLAQLNNRVYSMGARWGSLEMNRAALGGGWRYVASTAQQTGEWSQAQSGEDGVFVSPPTLEMGLDKDYDVIGVQVIFDEPGGEWAEEFKVSYYNAARVLLDERVFQNDDPNCSVNYQYNGVRYILLTFLKWNLPRRFAKICQVVPGQIRYFRDNNTYTFTLREKISPFEALTIPEYSIIFPNENQEFNIINPTGLISKLREYMEIPSNIGLVTTAGVEYVSVGNFPLFAWPDSANDETAALICRPDLAFANKNFTFSGAQIKTVEATAALISQQAGLRIPVEVDASLLAVQVNTRVDLDNTTPLQNALGALASATGGYIKFERDGTYTLKPITYGAAVRTITYDNMWSKPNIRQSQMIAGVTVKYVTYVPARGAGDFSQGNPENLINASVFVQNGDEIGRNIEIGSNFIRNETEARRIGGIALDFYGHRLSYDVDYRGDMSIEAGDIINVETDYGLRKILVMEHEITYDAQSFLGGRIRGVGI